MKKTFRTLMISLMAVLMLFTSCNDKLQKMEEGSVNEYIYPYIRFEKAEDGNSVTAVVVAGAQLNTVRIPATVDGVKVNTFIGFENPEDAKSVKEIVIGSHETVIAEEALKQAENLEEVKVESNSFFDKWGELPVLEKDGYEFLGWYAGEDKIYAGMPMNPNNSNAIPKWRAHKYIEHEGKEPTCTEAGWKPYKTCETCDYNDKVVLPALGHDFKHVDRISPTCTENGQIEHYICTRCGWLFSAPDPEARINDVVIQPEGHKMQHYPAKAPTCTGIGYDEHWVCTVCEKYFIKDSNDAYKEVSFADIRKDPIEHPWKSEWSYNKTHHWHECSDCGEKTDIEAHIWENPEVIQAPTESVPGKVRYTCKCGAEDIRTVQPENHEFKPIKESYTAATCTKDGYQDYICSICGLTYREIIPASGHKPEKVDRVEPTCQKEGNIEYWFCSQCENRYSAADCNEGSLIEKGKDVLPKVDHKFEGKWLSNENGHYKMCSFGCGTSSDLIPHVFDQEVATNDYIYSSPTCTKPGIYYKSCVCGYKSSTETFESTEEKDKPLDHNLVYHPASDKPCAEDGHIEYWECSRCQKKFSDADGKNEIKNIRAEHIPSSSYISDSDNHYLKCSVCDEILSIGAHDSNAWGADDEYHWRVCSVCGYEVGLKSKHVWEKIGDDYYCKICSCKAPEKIEGNGGFDIEVSVQTPKGHLEMSDMGNHRIKFVFADDNPNYPPTFYLWSVNDVFQNIEGNEFILDVKESFSYQVKCMVRNEGGVFSDSVMLDGETILNNK